MDGASETGREGSNEVPSTYTLYDGQRESAALVERVWLYVSLWENVPNSQEIDHLSKQFPNGFLVSVSTFRSSSIQNDDHFVKYGHI